MMVRSHANGDMKSTSLLVWMNGTNHFTACDALHRATALVAHTETGSVLVSIKGLVLVSAGESLLAALEDDNQGRVKITWNTFLRLAADVLEAQDGLLLEMQAVCYNHIIASAPHRAPKLDICTGRRMTRSSEYSRPSSPPPRKNYSYMS